jgi:phosphoglycolate phosphatase
LAAAFEELFDIPDAFRGIPVPGRTDAWILSQAVAKHGVPPDSPALARFPEVYLRHLRLEVEKPGPRKNVMPGVRELLDALSGRGDFYLALLTGNYEAAAQVKLRHFDLWRYFACGAFGDDAPDRNVLVAKALQRIVACGGPSFAAEDAIVIGDTPHDLACAQAAGARSIGVATGSHTAEELRAAGADAVLQDLGDTHEVLRVLQSVIRNPVWRKRLGVEPSPPA